MTITVDFAYSKPDTLEQAVELLTEHPTARVLAGGTDLVPWLRDDLVRPDLVVDIKGLPELRTLTAGNGVLRIGAAVTFSDLLESDLVLEAAPTMVEMAHLVASTGIRNRATVVGNICAAVPCCDSGPVLLVHDASVEVVGPSGQRTVPMSSWFVGPRTTSLAPGEIALAVTVPLQAHGGAFLKLARYAGEDLAQANLAVLALPERRYRLAFGAVAPVPLRAPRIEALLDGHVLTDELLREAKALVPEEISPITDLRASREYRTEICEVMLDRGLRAATSRLAGHGPPVPTRFL